MQKQSQKTLQIKRTDDCFEMSIYRGSLTPVFVLESSIKIRNSFPSLPKEFFDVFSDRIQENNFCDSRLKDAVNHVIDNCIYPSPTIAQFISFDRNVNLYSYEDMTKKENQSRGTFKRYKPVKIKGVSKPKWASISDIELYNLELINKD